MSVDEREEELRRYEEAGATHRRHLTDAALQVPIAQLPLDAPLVLRRDATVLDAVRLMQGRRHGAVAVVDASDRLVGVFTERDVLLKVVGMAGDPATRRLHEVMTPAPVTLRRSDPIGLALNRMSIGGYRHVPLVNGQGAPVGMLSLRDVGRFLAEFFPEAALNVPPNPSAVADARHGG
jgi:CBS domain-containing protein